MRYLKVQLTDRVFNLVVPGGVTQAAVRALASQMGKVVEIAPDPKEAPDYRVMRSPDGTLTVEDLPDYEVLFYHDYLNFARLVRVALAELRDDQDVMETLLAIALSKEEELGKTIQIHAKKKEEKR